MCLSGRGFRVIEINLLAAWIGILLGFLAGAVQGLFFHRDTWLGGYGSWQRRIMRLGHVSFFGIALINFVYAATRHILELPDQSDGPGWLFIVGAIGMPTVCYASAVHKPLRHLFPIPVIALIVGAGWFIYEGFVR
jgi:hypothetical protein